MLSLEHQEPFPLGECLYVIDDWLYRGFLKVDRSSYIDPLGGLVSLAIFFPPGIVPQRYSDAEEEYISKDGSSEDILPKPFIDETLEYLEWERGSFLIYSNNEQEETSERCDEIHGLQREENRRGGVLMAANKYDRPGQP